MPSTIWYHLYNLENVNFFSVVVLLLVKLQAKSNTPPWVVFKFLYKWYLIE